MKRSSEAKKNTKIKWAIKRDGAGLRNRGPRVLPRRLVQRSPRKSAFTGRLPAASCPRLLPRWAGRLCALLLLTAIAASTIVTPKVLYGMPSAGTTRAVTPNNAVFERTAAALAMSRTNRSPRNCPANRAPSAISAAFAPAVGHVPVWAVGFAPGLTLHLGNPTVANRSQHGWMVKILWVIQPSYRKLVRLHGWEAAHSTPLWFQIGGAGIPTKTPVLDPRHPGIPLQDMQPGKGYWIEFPSYLFIPTAGCSWLSARWPGGHWQLAFAAVR